MSEARCPICDSPCARARETSVGPRGELRVRECDACGFLYAPTSTADRDRHAAEYHSAHAVIESPVTATANAAGFLAYWSAQLGWPSTLSLLDVGCAEGRLIEVARSMGYDAEGIDVTDFYQARWAALGLPASTATLETFEPQRPAATYDLVVARQVIEHVSDPLGFLQACARLVRPGGACLIETGDARSPQARLEGARWSFWIPREGVGAHISFISRRTARVLAERAGLELRDSVPQLRYMPALLYAQSHGRRSLGLPGLGKFLLHQSRLSGARCYWFVRPPELGAVSAPAADYRQHLPVHA